MKKYNTTVARRQLPIKLIRSDPAYQRTIERARVSKIVKEFNKDLVNDIKVSWRDGKYYVFDGQHTLEALKKLNYRDVWCKVYTFVGLTDNDRLKVEAELFARQNGISRIVGLGMKSKALVVANDPEAVAFRDATTSVGVKLSFTKGHDTNKIACYAEALNAFRHLGSTRYGDMLYTIIRAWDGAPESLQGEIVGGLAIFYAAFAGKFDTKQLINKLRKVSPQFIIREGKASYGSGKKKFAEQILQIYNKRIPEAKKLEWGSGA